MKTTELRKKTAPELRDELLALRREQFNLRMAAASGQAARPDQFGKVRRNIARASRSQPRASGASLARSASV